jgi:hypothetical protein
MPEDVKVEAKPEVKQEATPEVKPQEDLVTRASKVVTEQPKKEEPVFNVNDIEKITDPQAKEYAEKAHKEFERTYQKKFQELAAIRKDYETNLQQKQNDKWTPERVQSLLNDKEFVNAAQSVVGTQTTGESEYSSMTDSEKRTLEDNNQKINALYQQNAQLQRQQQDESLKGKYANYAPDFVDLEVNNLLSGKRQATREDIWKVLDYEKAVQRAYQLGKQDRQVEQGEKLASVSTDGISVSRNEAIEPEKGESDHSFFKRIFLKNLADKGNTLK